MKSNIRRLYAAACLIVVAAACSDSNEPNNGNPNNNSTITATFDPEGIGGATQFVATAVLGAKSGDNPNSTMGLIAVDAQDRRIEFSVTGNSTGSHQVGYLISGSTASFEVGSQYWTTTFTGATGTITVTTRTATYMSGSFNFTLAPAPGTGATGTMTISGTFTAYFGQT